LTINIQTCLPEKYSLNGNDLYYNHRINLYEYYFTDLFPITLPNDLRINLVNSEEFNNSVKIPCLGIKTDGKRGDLYIYKELDLTIHNKDHYREILKEIFT
jgi:DnaJ-class molecular chaperone